jgi:hypothetical protein
MSDELEKVCEHHNLLFSESSVQNSSQTRQCRLKFFKNELETYQTQSCCSINWLKAEEMTNDAKHAANQSS